MAKPAITFRSTKGSPLTYTELDTNFDNLQDATVGFTVGATNADIDLNSRLTVAAGSNITLTLAGSTLTIAATGGSGDTYAISAETATGGVDLRLTGGLGTTDNVKFANGTNITLTRTSADQITINGTNQFAAISVGGTNITPDQAQDTLTLSSSSGNLTLTPDSGTDTIAFGFSSTPSFDRVLVQSGTGVTSAIDCNPASGVYGIEIRCPGSTPTAGVHFKGTSGTLLSMRFTDVQIAAAGSKTLDGYIQVTIDGNTRYIPYYS
jgi:hypothetical protein